MAESKSKEQPAQTQVETPQFVIDAAEAALDAAIVRHSDGEETFIQCLACGGWEEHSADCFVPILDRWLNADPLAEEL